MPRRRRTVAQHARLRSPHPFTQLVKLLAVAATVVLVAVAGVTAYTAVDLTSEYVAEAVVVENQPAIPPDLGQLEGGVNMMVVGIDACEEQLKALFGERCEGPDAEGQLNDVNILLHISDAPRRVTVVSFPRDLLFEAPACDTPDGGRWGGGPVQINEISSYGGLSCVMTAVSDMSGQQVQFGAMVTFGGVIEITNAIGGVEICLASPMRDENTAIDWPAGPRTIQGYEALQFLRTRYGVGGSDLARISNQQQYMSRLARKLVSEEVLSNPATVFRLASTGLRNVTPTQSLTNPLTLVQIASAVKDVPFEDIVFVQYPTVTASSDANRVEPNYAAAQVLWDALSANQGIEVTGAVGANDGVVAEPAPGETAAPTDAPEVEPGTVDPATGSVALPESITGSSAAQQTCSNGVVN
ncbi:MULTISPECIES: LCP family protein [Microbacterium]|jgi:LCP family protein required for cell wall assembly|uniref:LCP family protein n=1 Tax=Microbacterium TaxID=33882 RepID=UPI0023DB1216|nr:MULTISPECIES: LCP family protein [Microbacterium]MDF2044707.1 LCP family protein [Microbacterium sp. Kw_RZR3]MDQ1074572.1 LCP family protein required for cell wall assembly [Microbacterium sp. SORGH_AS_0969]MDQ1114800.1 LCP family protein required for cell wall assembly [Microbacterium testaceum]